MSDKDTPKEELRDQLKQISALTGSAINGFLGLALPDATMVGILLGNAVTFSISKIGSELLNRVYSNKQELKVSISYLTAVHTIANNLEQGKPINQDLITEDENDDPGAEKLLDSCVIYAQNEVERKKLFLMGRLTGNLMFETLRYEQCAYYLKITERLTLRQICFLYLLKNRASYSIPEFNPTHTKTNARVLSFDLRMDIDELVKLRILEGSQLRAIRHFIHVSMFQVSEVGDQFYRLIGLDDLPNICTEEIENLRTLLT